MDKRNYWLTVFTGATWQEFLDSGSEVAGFPQGRWQVAQKITPGDYLICYLARVSRWIAVLEVTSHPFLDSSPIWKHGEFPCRVKVRVVVSLEPETAIPVLDLKDKLSIFVNLRKPTAWAAHFRISPKQWKDTDGAIVVEQILEANRNPSYRPIEGSKLTKR